MIYQHIEGRLANDTLNLAEEDSIFPVMLSRLAN
jgi:hypothetical protein